MADLDQLYTNERLKADSADLQQRLLGRTLHEELIHLEASKPAQVSPEDVGFTQPTNVRSNEEIDALLNGRKELTVEDPRAHEIRSQELPAFTTAKAILADPRMEAVGAGLTTGGAMTGQPELLVPGLAIMGMARLAKGAEAGGLLRPRFNVEETMQRALNPSPLAERVTEAINSKTAVLTDSEAQAQADALRTSGGVTRETLTGYAPGTALVSAPQALAAQDVLTQESRAFIDTARHALDTNDPQMADQALAQFGRLLDPAGGFSGAVTTTGQTLRVASNADIKALNLLLERSSKTGEGMTPLEQLRVMMADPATDPAKQGRSLTQSFRNVMTQAQEVVATGDQAAAAVLLHEIQAVVEEEAQLGLFATEQDVKQAQQVIKNVTAQHIVEANKAAIAKDDKETFKLTPTGPHQPNTSQEDYLKEAEKNRLATIKEHQAQDLRVSEGTSVFSPKREPFKLTAPPGGARRPSPPKQLDLLNMIAKEPEPEQLALEMAAAVEHPELSKQFLSMIRKAQDAITVGKTDAVGTALEKIQTALTPKAKPSDGVTQPTRLTAQEKKALQQFFAGAKDRSVSDLEMLKALVSDTGLQPDALITALNNLKKPGWKDGAQYLLINSMLTPASVFVNFAATASMLPVHLAARTVGARVGQTARLLGGKAGVMVGEDEAMLHGLYASFWDSVKLAGRVGKTGNAEIGPQALKEQAMGTHPITANALFENAVFRRAAGIPESPVYNSASYPVMSRAGLVSAAINFFGVATGLPGRLMLTGDQFIQSLAMNAEMHALVYRKASEQAVRDGWTLEQFYKSYAPLWRQIQKDLPEELRTAGEQFSLEVSLNKKAGPLGQRILALREEANQATGIGGTIALPFYNTLANGAKATWEFSPLAPASNAFGLVAKTFRADMFGDDPIKRDLAVGKWAFGSMLMSSLVWAAFNGRLTGRGPDNKELRQEGWEAQGLPDSWVYNTDTGERVQINRLGILSNLAGMAADVAEVWPQADEQTKADMAQLLVTAYVGNLSFDFLQNSAGVTQALVNGVKRKEDLDLLAKSMGAFIPLGGTFKAAEKALADNPPLMKDARTTLDKMLARFPGYDALAKQYGLDPVPVLRNQFGYAVKQPTALYGTEWFNPLFISAPSQNETLRKLSEIELALGLKIQAPANIIGEGKLPLTAREYDRYQRLAGQHWEQRAEQLLPTLQRTDLPDQVKRDLIMEHLMTARRTATAVLKGESRDLVEAMTHEKMERYTQPHTPKRVTRPPSPRQGVAHVPHLDQ